MKVAEFTSLAKLNPIYGVGGGGAEEGAGVWDPWPPPPNTIFQQLARGDAPLRPRQKVRRFGQDREGHVLIMTWCSTSKPSWLRPPFMAKDTARCGPGCVMPASGLRKGGSCV